MLDLASRLLPAAAPTVRPTRSIRRGTDAPKIIRVAPDELAAQGTREARELVRDGLLVGLIVANQFLASMAASVTGSEDIGSLDRDGITKPITLVAASAVKGLEFDAVVVVEPSAIAGSDARGLRMLYVAMTRPIRRLTIVHAQPLPPQFQQGVPGERSRNPSDR